MHWDTEARYRVIEQLVRAKLAGGEPQLELLDENARVQALLALVLGDRLLYESDAIASYDLDPVERIIRRIVREPR